MNEPIETTRFAYSGRVSARFVMAALSGAALAALLGLLYQQLLDANPLILLSPLLTVVLGILLGGLSLAMLRQGHVRHRATARALVWSLPVLALFFAHLESLGFGREGFPGLMDALRQRLARGDVLPGGDHGLSGASLVLFWFTELVCVVSIAVAIPMTWWNRTVFDEQARCFLVRKRVAVRYGASAFAVNSAVRERGMGALLEMGLRSHAENSEEGELRFYLHEPAQGDIAWLTVQWFGKLEGPRGRMMQRDVMVLRRVQVDRDYLKDLLGY